MGASGAIRGPTTPGICGYALAIACTLVVFTLEVTVADVFQEGLTPDTSSVFLVVLIFGSIPAAVIGTVGAVVIHLLTKRMSRQRWHVGVAALVGLTLGLAIPGDPGERIVVGSAFAGAVGAGRWVVVPLARARARKQLARLSPPALRT